MKDTPVVLIHGPRQSGKTTLVKEYSPSLPYFTLDDDNILNAVKQDPVGFVNRIDTAIIDEIQRAPELLRAVKLSIDENRQSGRFLLTGSANLLALPQIGDSLAGRMETLTLFPLSLAEIQRRENHFIKYALDQSWPSHVTHSEQSDVISQALSGGYPEMLTRPTVERRNAWAKSYIKAIVERDVKDINRKISGNTSITEGTGSTIRKINQFYSNWWAIKFRYQNSAEVCRFTGNTIFSTSIKTLA